MSSKLSADSPIGVFDSGVGGLTVVRCIQSLLPSESLIYVADQAHVPYGGRPLEEIQQFACGISAALFASGCKAVVMACNLSSAVALRSVQARHPDRIALGVVLPGAQTAVTTTRNGSIGVLATEGTVRSAAYTRALQEYDPGLRVTEVACPRFVPLVESGAFASEEAHAACAEYLAPLCAAEADTVILGCTHYPFLLPVLERLAIGVIFVDPAERTALALSRELQTRNLRRDSSPLPQRRFFTTGSTARFAAQTRVFLDSVEPTRIAPAHWQNDTLSLG